MCDSERDEGGTPVRMDQPPRNTAHVERRIRTSWKMEVVMRTSALSECAGRGSSSDGQHVDGSESNCWETDVSERGP